MLSPEQRKTLRTLLEQQAPGPSFAPRPAKTEDASTTCMHLGAKIPGQPCGSQLYRCEKFGEVTTRHTKCSSASRHCASCPEFTPGLQSRPADLSVRHLLYHVYAPQGSLSWRRGIDNIRMRWPLFNGRKLFAVITGPELEHHDKVIEYLPHGCEVVKIPNVAALREVVSWIPMWSRLLSTESTGVAFYGHTKAATRPDDPGNSCQWWASLLYSLSLDHWSRVADVLRRYPIAGSFKKVGRGFVGSKSSWHYSGSFFWARLDDIKRRDWKAVDKKWWGTESWPGKMYKPTEAGCVFHEGRVPTLDLYSPGYWTKIREEYSQWLQSDRTTTQKALT